MTKLCENAPDSHASAENFFGGLELPDRLRLTLPSGLSCDLPRIATQVAALAPQSWIHHFVPEHYSGSWDVVPLRAPTGAIHPILRIAPHPGITAWSNTPELFLCPALEQLIAGFHCPLGAVRLMRLAPGSIIHEHCDPGLDAYEGTVRLHIPLATGPGVVFALNGSLVPIGLGECWYLRLADPHSVRHNGATPRIHLVIDAEINNWLAKLLRDAM